MLILWIRIEANASSQLTEKRKASYDSDNISVKEQNNFLRFYNTFTSIVHFSVTIFQFTIQLLHYNKLNQ